MKKIIVILFFFLASFSYAQIAPFKGIILAELSTTELNALANRFKVEGSLYYDTTLNKFVTYSGSAFEVIGGTATTNASELTSGILPNARLATSVLTSLGLADTALQSFTELDGSVTNEIQTLSISGNDLSLSLNGGTITLPGTEGEVYTAGSGLNLVSNAFSLQSAIQSAIDLNTAKTGITTNQANAILANSDKIGISNEQADAILFNSDKVGVSTEQANIIANTSGTNTGNQDISGIAVNANAINVIELEQNTQNNAIALNTDKVGLTDGSVTTARLADNAVNTVKILNGAVTSNKLNNTGVSSGIYVNPVLTIGIDGRISNAMDGETSSTTWGSITGNQYDVNLIGFEDGISASGGDDTWTARITTEQNFWNSIAYGSGLFVAISSNGANNIMTSTDGITWNQTFAVEQSAWSDITFGNGLFVAIAQVGTNKIITSTDGVNWILRASPEQSQYTSLTYGNGLFVVVGGVGTGGGGDGTSKTMTSPDGINWTSQLAVEQNNWFDIAYGNGLFVAVSESGTNRVMTSPDGINWTSRLAAEQNNWQNITYGNGLFVAVSRDGTNRVMTSTDGTTWVSRVAAEQNSWSSIAFGGGLFLATSASGTNRVMTSPNGINWTSMVATEQNFWNGLAYGNGLFVATSASGTNRVMTYSPESVSARKFENTVNEFQLADGTPIEIINKVLKFPEIASVTNYAVNVISTNTNAVAGQVYVFTSNVTLTLPIAPTAGDWIEVSNLSATPSPIIARNGKKIVGLEENLTIDTAYAGFRLVFTGDSLGWTIIGQ